MTVVSSKSIIIVAVLAAFVIGLSLGLLGSALRQKDNFSVEVIGGGTIPDCMEKYKTIDSTPTGNALETMHVLIEDCYSMIRNQQLLNDFQIRRVHYFEQYRSGNILLWLVVIITFSGVLLAAAQLAASYRLAFEPGTSWTLSSEIGVQRDSVVLRSSVTGLFILIISFAFFLTFVIYIYHDKEEVVDAPSKNSVSSGPVLQPGGMGSPPSEK